jgi:hypothetical protein
MKQNNVFLNIYSMFTILIQGNEGIVKFFTLMLEGPFEQSYGV